MGKKPAGQQLAVSVRFKIESYKIKGKTLEISS